MNIWESIETGAWARGFGYDGYLDFHNKTGNKGSKLSQEGYVSFCELMESEMIASMS